MRKPTLDSMLLASTDPFATAIDPDGNYVQIIQLSDEARAAMGAGQR